MAKKNFLLLLSLNQANARLGTAILAKVKKDIDAGAAPAWIDSRGVGIFISSALAPIEVWRLTIPELKTTVERQSMKDAMLLELGSRHLGFPETKAMAWLNSHSTAAPTEE